MTGGMDGKAKVVVEKVVTFLVDEGLEAEGNEEEEDLQKMRPVFGSEEWVEVPWFEGSG